MIYSCSSCSIRSGLRLSLACLLAGFAALAAAQTPPDAGVLQRETERSLRTVPEVSPPAPPARPMAEDAKAARVQARAFVIEGASLIPADELAGLLADLVGRSLTLGELEQAAQRIVRHYRERGWWVRAYLPEQDATDGRIRIRVVEGRYGGLTREDAGGRVDGAWVERLVAGRLVEGEPLPAAVIERGLLLANDLPGIRATGVLEPGDAPGLTRLRLRVDVEDAPRVRGNIGLGNGGIKAIGTVQALGGLALDNLSGRGDRLALQGLTAKGVDSARLSWRLPVGADGWSVGAHASHLRYRLGDRFKTLDGKGKADTAGVEAQWAWLRQGDRNLSLFVGHEQRRYADDLLGAPSRRHRIDAFTLGLHGDRRDAFGGGGVLWGGLRLAHGRLDIADVAGDKAADAAGPRAAGGYARLSGQLGRLQALDGGFRLLVDLSGQWADGNLSAPEKFVLGGPEGVRAYPVNEGTGDQGILLRLEAQRPFGHGWLARVFYDAGQVRQHKRPWAGWDGGTGQPNRYSLSGAGIGIGYDADIGRTRWRLSANLAAPVGRNPGRDANDRNNDGSRANAARFWISASAAF